MLKDTSKWITCWNVQYMPSKNETSSSPCVSKATYSCYRKRGFTFHRKLIQLSILGLHSYSFVRGSSTAEEAGVAILGPTNLPLEEDLGPWIRLHFYRKKKRRIKGPLPSPSCLRSPFVSPALSPELKAQFELSVGFSCNSVGIRDKESLWLLELPWLNGSSARRSRT